MGFGSDFSGAMGLFEFEYHRDVENVARVEVDISSMFYPPQDEHSTCQETGPQKETHLPTPLFFRCYFSFRVSVRHYLWIWFLHLQLFLPGFFQPYPPKIPAQVEEKAENIQLPPVPQGRNWRNW